MQYNSYQCNCSGHRRLFKKKKKIRLVSLVGRQNPLWPLHPAEDLFEASCQGELLPSLGQDFDHRSIELKCHCLYCTGQVCVTSQAYLGVGVLEHEYVFCPTSVHGIEICYFIPLTLCRFFSCIAIELKNLIACNPMLIYQR